MGYFSNMAIDMCDGKDHSYPSPEQQLLWRLDDLKDRLEELIAADGPYRSGYIYTEDDIRYALSEHLDDICKVERAIELTKADLLEKYGINLCEEIEDNMNLDGHDTTSLDVVTEGRKSNAVVTFDSGGDKPPLHTGDVITISQLKEKKSSTLSILHRLQLRKRTNKIVTQAA